MKTIIAGGIAAFALVVAGSAFAEPTTFKAPMTAQAEVPPNASVGNGVIEATFDPATKKLDWKSF